MLSRMGSNASDQPTLSYEALSAAYESIILTETADDREISDAAAEKMRKLFENSDENTPEGRRLGSLGTVPGEVVSLPRNAMRLKRVTAEEEYVNTTAPREQMVLRELLLSQLLILVSLLRSLPRTVTHVQIHACAVSRGHAHSLPRCSHPLLSLLSQHSHSLLSSTARSHTVPLAVSLSLMCYFQVLLHKALLASGALSGVEPTRTADDVADEDEPTVCHLLLLLPPSLLPLQFSPPYHPV